MNFKDIKKEILKGIVENCSSDNKQVKKIDEINYFVVNELRTKRRSKQWLKKRLKKAI